MARKIFINYRRSEDWGAAQALYQQLESELPDADLFMDVEGRIKPGDDFVAVLTAQVAACEVLLAVIGPRWAELLAARAGDPEDFVVIEIAAAVSQGKILIPVLVGGATMPNMLPKPIEKLAHIHAANLRHESYNSDYQVLLRFLKQRLASVEQQRAARVEAKRVAAEVERSKRTAEEAARRAEARARSVPSSKPSLWPAGLALGLGLSILVGFLVYWWPLAAPTPVLIPQPPVVAVPHPPKVEPPALAARNPALSVSPGSGKSFRDTLADGQACSYCPEMVVVPAGSFLMGLSPSEIAALKKEYPANQGFSMEAPQHRVTIERPFAVGRVEVNFDEWDACVRDHACTHIPDQGWGRGRRPVTRVSWDKVTQQYLPWLSRKTGKNYRLLTEAEWEYVARAGTTTRYWWGSSISKSQAAYFGSVGGQTVPVESFAANPWGLHNVHGNAHEWVQDCWHWNYDGAPSDGTAWIAGDCGHRVTRGGSYNNGPAALRSANRAGDSSAAGALESGFRVGRTL